LLFQIIGSKTSYAANNLITFELKFNTFENKLNIPEFSKRFENQAVFNTSDILMFYREMQPTITVSTVNWRVYKLVEKGILVRVGQGKFKLGKSSPFQPEINNRIIKINNFIKARFPYIHYCIWDSSAIIEFGLHIPKTNMTFADVDRESAESIYYSLKEEFKQVFYKPTSQMLNEYINELDKVIIVRPLVTEAPIQKIKGVPTIQIEKLLVDALTDDEFFFLRGNEILHVYENAFSRYSINLSKLIRYSDRKRKKPELIALLNNYKLAVLHDLLP
jgi:hypothetical protein